MSSVSLAKRPQFMLTVLQVVVIPYQFIRERYFTPYEFRSPFVQRATVFQDIVIRFVRYAFANMPAWLGRVFFSKGVSLPFLRFRMLRHGIVTAPLRWQEINRVSHHHTNNCAVLTEAAQRSRHLDSARQARATRHYCLLLPRRWLLHGL